MENLLGIGLRGGIAASVLAILPVDAVEISNPAQFAPDSNTRWLAIGQDFLPPDHGPGPVTFDIYLNYPHSPKPAPSWYGESIGHYEGDTLVVDTTGLNGRVPIDNYRTPHTPKMHVVERFHMTDGGKMLEADVTVEDPGTLTMAWSAKQRWRRQQASLADVCGKHRRLFP